MVGVASVLGSNGNVGLAAILDCHKACGDALPGPVGGDHLAKIGLAGLDYHRRARQRLKLGRCRFWERLIILCFCGSAFGFRSSPFGGKGDRFLYWFY